MCGVINSMKALFNKRIKYNGQWFAPGQAFEIDEKDKNTLAKLGASIMTNSNMKQVRGANEEPLDIFKMSTKELAVYCQRNGISLEEIDSKDRKEILGTIYKHNVPEGDIPDEQDKSPDADIIAEIGILEDQLKDAQDQGNKTLASSLKGKITVAKKKLSQA